MTVADAMDRWAMQFELTKLGFALAAYRADRGSYPAKLVDLLPKYVTEIPKDIFSEGELHYKRQGDGYLLYSVGPNGKEDSERCDWDDIVLCVPAEMKQK